MVVERLSVRDVVTVKYFFFTISRSEVMVVGTVTNTDVVSDIVVSDFVVFVILLYFLTVLVVVSRSVMVVGATEVCVITVSTGFVMINGSVTVSRDGTVTLDVFVFVMSFSLCLVVTSVSVSVAVAVLVKTVVVGETDVKRR